jgi:hypothetical protein
MASMRAREPEKRRRPMQRDQVFSVVGLRENGDRVIITRDTTHNTAEQIMSLMTTGSGFVELFIEAGDDETPAVEQEPAASEEQAPAEFAHNK